jgi:hypothetical protein
LLSEEQFTLGVPVTQFYRDSVTGSGSAAASWATWRGCSGCAPGFALNYAATGLVIDLLDRIAVFEAAMRRRARL